MILLTFYTFLGINKNENYLSHFNSVFIFLLLLFNIIYYFIYNTNINNIGFIFYKLNYIINFIFLYTKFNKIIKYDYFKNQNFYNICLYTQVLILCIYIISVILHYTLNILFLSNYLIINILLNISEFYGIFLYLNNILFFILIFVKLLQDIYIIYDDLNNNIEKNNKKGLIDFFHKIVNLKNIVTYTINDFNYILNIFTIINLFSLGLLYHIFDFLVLNNKIYFIILFIFFCIVELLCLSIVILITTYRTDIFNKIYDPLFVNNFIKRYDINTFNDMFEIQLEVNNINVNQITLFNILEENSTSIDWIILNITLNSKWVDFDLFGIKIYNLNSINQIIVLAALFYKIVL